MSLNAAFAGGQVDGGIIGAAAANKFTADGVGKVIAWTGDQAPWQLGAQITSPKLVKEHPQTVQAFVTAYQKGIAAYYAAFKIAPDGTLTKGPGFDEMAGIVAKYLGLKPEDIPGILPSFDPKGGLDVPDIKAQVAFYQSQNLVDKAADVDKMVDTQFLKGK